MCLVMIGGVVFWGVVVVVVLVEELFEGVEQFFECGDIFVVFDFEFVLVFEVGMFDDVWVFGVVVEGQVKVYSFNLFNVYEVVNDEVGGKVFVVVW